MGYLVGLVMNEALLLRLCLRISPRVDKEVLRRDMLNLAIQTIKGFQRFYFLDMLLKMLLEPDLPVAASLSCEDALLLREVLYDAVILFVYSFYHGCWAHSDSIVLSKKLSLAWVLAVDHAVQFARATRDDEKAISYLKAYRESLLVTGLMNWVYSQIGMVHRHTRHEITTPRALINWLLALEGQGFRVFDQSMPLLRAKAVACVESEQSNLNQSRFDLNVSIEHEDQEMVGQLSSGIEGDHLKMDRGKKREEASSGMGEPQNKQIKLASHCENAVIYISSDDDME